MSEKNRRLMIAAPGSGSGKTIVTCGLLRLLSRRGYKLSSFKCGPDYIDPMFHKSVLGIPSRNLDLFMAGREGVTAAIQRGMSGSDLGIIEGVMGFFDGMSPTSYKGSSYDLSCVTDTPVILVVNARGMSNSLIPLVKGFCSYGDRKMIRGIFLNNISKNIAAEMSEKILKETGVPVIGTLLVLREAGLGSRHLGLVLPGEIPELLSVMDKVADEMEKTLDIDKLTEIAEGAGELEVAACKKNAPPKVSVGVARDEAFCFYYEDNIELIKEFGGEPVFFSPIHDTRLPPVSRLIFGGGYPELFAKELSENTSMLKSIREACGNGMPVLAECGGFLYLMESLINPDGEEFKMAGVLPGRSKMRDGLSHFGYVTVTKNKDNPYLLEGEEIRGHEFHYYETDMEGEVCKMTKPSGKRSWMGYQARGKVFAGFAHLYYPSCKPFIKRFLDA